MSKITSLGGVFDASQIAPATALEAVPAGWYNLEITDGELKPNDNGNGLRAQLELTVIDGQFKGRKIFDGIQLRHSNSQTAEIGQKSFSSLCHATGKLQVGDLTQLFRIPFTGKIGLDPARTVDGDNNESDANGNAYAPGTPGTKTYEAKNTFRAAKPFAGAVASGAPAAPGTVGNFVPSWGAPASNAPAPAAPASAASIPSGVPAWGAAPAAPAGNALAATTPPATKGKPGRKPKAAAAPAAPERKFYVGLEGPQFEKPISEAVLISDFFAKGMPATTPLCLDGEEEWKTAAQYGIGAAPAAPVAPSAPVQPPAAPFTPPAATAPAPAWGAPPAAAPAAPAPSVAFTPPWGK